jgi:hypothetical protein
VIGYDVVEPSGYYKMVQRGRAGCALPRLSARGVQAPIKPPHILAGYTFLFENMLGEALFVPRNVEKREEIIKGVDGNDIKLFISTPTACGPGPFPCLYHIHGGGMAILMAEDTLYSRVRDMYVRPCITSFLGAMSSYSGCIIPSDRAFQLA